MIELFALAAASLFRCSVERAHYVLRRNRNVMAYIKDVDSGLDWPSGLALAVHHGALSVPPSQGRGSTGEGSPCPGDKGWKRACIRRGVQDSEGRPTPR